MTSLLGPGAAGVLGLELVGLGGPLLSIPSFMLLFLLRDAPGAKDGSTPPFKELVSEFCLL